MDIFKPRGGPPTLTRWHVALLLVGPIALAIAGFTHPAHLTEESASWWHTVHIVMLPLFPLLAVNIWVLLRGVWSGVDGWLATAARLLAFVYAACYTALDVLAGIANGALMIESNDSGLDVVAAKSVMFGEGNRLAEVGVFSLLVATLLLGGLYIRRFGTVALPGSLVLVASSYSFLDSHVYPVRGVVTMLGFALGAALLAIPALRASQRSPQPTLAG